MRFPDHVYRECVSPVPTPDISLLWTVPSHRSHRSLDVSATLRRLLRDVASGCVSFLGAGRVSVSKRKIDTLMMYDDVIVSLVE